MSTEDVVRKAIECYNRGDAETVSSLLHGLVAISLEDRFVGLTADILDREMMFLVERLAGR